jgi:hypothetical protein
MVQWLRKAAKGMSNKRIELTVGLARKRADLPQLSRSAVGLKE